MAAKSQWYLGRSFDGQLCLKSPRLLSSQSPVGPCWISVLPDELLLEIFVYLPPKQFYQLAKGEYGFPLLLVCKAWRRIYETIILQRINISRSYGGRSLLRTRKLLNILQSRPYLQTVPRSISIKIHHTPSQATAFRLSASILKYCTALRHIEFHSDYTNEMCELPKAIKALPRLEYLSLSSPSSSPTLQFFVQFFSLPSLKTLRLSRYGIGRSSETLVVPWSFEPPLSITQTDLENIFPPHRYHTGSVTSLELSDPSTLPNVTEHILRWPSCLTNLSITCLSQSTCGKYYTIEAMQRLLNIHSHSLKHITLGKIMDVHTGMPDFSSFPYLEDLSMSAYNVMKSETASDAIRKLSAPNLCRLSLCSSYEDPHSDGRDDFGKDHVTWIHEFAKLKKEQYPNNKLQKVIIFFNPGEDPHWIRRRLRDDQTYLDRNEDPELATWPWEYLEQAKQSVAEFGLVIDFHAHYTKDEWDRIISDEKIERQDFLEDLQPGLSQLFLENSFQ